MWLSVVFSATDSMAEAAAKGPVRLEGSHLTKFRRLSRAAANWPPSNACLVVFAADDSPLTVKVVRRITASPTT